MTPEPDGAVTPPSHDDESGGDAVATEPEAGATEHDQGAAGLSPEEEPTTTGTLFIMILFLMALAGMWGLMYLTLLEIG